MPLKFSGFFYNLKSDKNLAAIAKRILPLAFFAGSSLPFLVLFFADYHQGLFAPFLAFSTLFCTALGFVAVYFIDKYLLQSVNYSQQIAASLVKGNFVVEIDEEKGKFPLILKELSLNFSKIINTLKELNDVSASGFNNYRTMLDEINEVIDYQNQFSQKVKSFTDNFVILLKERNESTSSLERIISETSASTEEISVCSGQITNSIEAFSAALEEVSAIVEETSASIEIITLSSESLLASTEETSAAMIELSENAKQSVSDAQETANVAQQMKSAAQDGNKSVQETVSGITSLQEIVVKAAYVIENLGSSTQKIGDIVNVIREIADQTNLLALNAAIEAARAGEHGRGFAVVADEVRKLAERSSHSTKEIAMLIKSIQEEAIDAVNVVKGGAASAEDATKLAHQAGTKINQVLDGVEYTAQLVEKIANSSIDQSGVADIVAESTRQMNQQVLNVNQSIKEQSIGVRHILEALGHIKVMMEQIQGSLTGQGQSYEQMNFSFAEINNQFKALAELSGKEEKTFSGIFSEVANAEEVIFTNRQNITTCIDKIETTLDKTKAVTEILNQFNLPNTEKGLITLNQ